MGYWLKCQKRLFLQVGWPDLSLGPEAMFGCALACTRRGCGAEDLIVWCRPAYGHVAKLTKGARVEVNGIRWLDADDGVTERR